MRRWNSFCSLLGLLLPALVACGGNLLPGKQDELEDTLEIYSWLTGPGEDEALEELLRIYKQKHPEVSPLNAALRDPTNAREELAARLEDGEPPDTFQAISGSDLRDHVNKNRMEPIAYIGERNGLDGVVNPVVLDTAKTDETLFAVPINIERDNNLYYNVALLEELGITPPNTLEGFYDMCAQLQAEHPEIYPLAMPPAGWVLALVVFEALMPGLNGGRFYLDFFNGEAQFAEGSADIDELERLFTEFFKIAQCSNVDAGAATDEDYAEWERHGDAVYDGAAATIVMGDWIKGYFEAGVTWKGDQREPWVAGVHFDAVRSFGSGDHFTFNSAAFGLPIGAPHPRAAEAFLDIAASKEAQAAFNAKKGSVPARIDVDLSVFDDMVRMAATDFQYAAAGEDLLLPGYASLTTFDFQKVINAALVVFTLGGDKAATMLNSPRETIVRPAEEQLEPGDIDYIVQKIVANYGHINP